MKQQLLASDVVRATGISGAMLGRWYDRGTIKQSKRDKASRGSGTYREFSRNTIVQIAIAKRLIELGLSASRATDAASIFTDDAQYGRSPGKLFQQGRTILCIRASGAIVLNALFDAGLSELSNYETCVIALDCGKICSEIDDFIKTKGNK